MEPLIGTVLDSADSFVPAGWMECNGQFLSIAQHAALFSLLGVQFGGDGISTFALPNLAPRLPGLTWIIAVDGVITAPVP